MSAEERVLELLARWDSERRAGHELSAEKLCANCPEFVGEVREGIRKLQRVNPMLELEPDEEPVTWAKGICPVPGSGYELSEGNSFNKGDEKARAVLVNTSYERLRRLAKAIFHQDFPRLASLEETGDVLNQAAMRLVLALRAVSPPTVRDYFRLSAEKIRHTLVDMARAQDRRGGTPDPGDAVQAPDPADSALDPARLAERTEFLHKVAAVVATLAPEDREVIDLLYYHELSQRDAAEVMGMGWNQSSVHRRWVALKLKLAGLLT